MAKSHEQRVEAETREKAERGKHRKEQEAARIEKEGQRRSPSEPRPLAEDPEGPPRPRR